MPTRPRWRRWFESTGSEILGWFLTALGVLMVPLPGPGLVVLFAGVALLARNHGWARRAMDPLSTRARQTARLAVATRKRIILGVLGGGWLCALGVVWLVSPEIPEFDIWRFKIGPELPGSRLASGIGLILSALASWAVLAYSVRRYRG